MIDFLQEIDANLLLFFNSRHNVFFDSFMSIATGKFIWVPFYVALVFHLFYRYGWRRGLTWLVMTALAVALADQICATIIRPWVGRLRPANLMNPISEFVHVVNGYRGGNYGFPSCHGSNSFALTTIMWLLLPRKSIRIGLVAWTLVNVYSRIYLGVHYPGDILAGAIIGFLSALLLLKTGKILENYFGLNAIKERKSTILMPMKSLSLPGGIISEPLIGLLTIAQLVLLSTILAIAIAAI